MPSKLVACSSGGVTSEETFCSYGRGRKWGKSKQKAAMRMGNHERSIDLVIYTREAFMGEYSSEKYTQKLQVFDCISGHYQGHSHSEQENIYRIRPDTHQKRGTVDPRNQERLTKLGKVT